MKAEKISVVIPVFNEEDVLEALFKRLMPVMENLQRNYEVLMVDDGSTDRSLEIMKEHAGDRVVIVELTKNYGQHAAVFAGFENSEGDIVVTLDADLQNPPEEIPRLVCEMDRGVESFFRKVDRA